MAPGDRSLDAEPTDAPATVDERGASPPAPRQPGLGHYTLGAVIGAGGMGEVLEARDRGIGRTVAVKRMRDAQPAPARVERFLREAKIQARLDHPAIVPVYELGFDTGGGPFFTMKKLAGVTLSKVLADGATPQRLFRALVDVCNAIDFAHARGIVHRDLKPSNIMLGDYGEVYVLDWGVARVLGTRDSAPILEVDAGEGTMTGAMLGTPGFMAPEQIRSHEVGPAADIYALGAILFEMLCGQRLHPSGKEALQHTLVKPTESPSNRARDREIPPELDVLCTQMLGEDPAQRPTAHAVSEALQHYLDGDRDHERRRALAGELADRAAVLHRERPDDRAEIMRLAGRAIVLDPECVVAGRLLGSLLFDPPKQLPPQLEAEISTLERTQARDRSRRAYASFLVFFALAPVILFLDIISWPMFVAVQGSVVVVALFVRRAAVAGTLVPWWAFGGVQLLCVVLFTRIASPFALAPILTCGMLISISANPWFRARPRAVIAWTLLAAGLPVALELVGVFGTTWEVRPDGVLLSSEVFGATPVAANMTIGINALFLVLVAVFTYGVARDRSEAQRQLHVQAWHLRQLLPG